MLTVKNIYTNKENNMVYREKNNNKHNQTISLL